MAQIHLLIIYQTRVSSFVSRWGVSISQNFLIVMGSLSSKRSRLKFLFFILFLLLWPSIIYILSDFFFRLPNLVISKFLKHFLKLRPFSSGCNANLWGTTLIILMQSYNCFLNIDSDIFLFLFFFFLFNLIS